MTETPVKHEKADPSKVRFELEYPLTDLAPADYNPRHLSEEAFARLKASIAKHGVIKPVILNANGTLVAGHQRTKALKALGFETVPAVVLSTTVRLQDEIMFNLLHNRIEVEASIVHTTNPGQPGEWSMIRWQDIEVEEVRNPAFVSSIGDMVAGHGPWGSVVCDDQGRIFLNAEYAVACAQQHHDVLAWTCTMQEAGEAYTDLTGEYGVYDWTNIDAPVYNQHIVQPKRLRERAAVGKHGRTGLHNKSETWERLVLKWLTPAHRVVDFGAGYGDYARTLREQGYQVWDYEPFRCTQGSYAIDIKSVVKMIRDLERTIREDGLLDVVVLDSVINATTSLEYQHAVLTVVNALVRADGIVAIGTRGLKAELKRETAGRAAGTADRMSFLDKDNVELKFHMGKWQTLRFHTEESLRELLLRYFDDVQMSDTYKATMKAVCRGPKKIDLDDLRVQAETEFNMPYPNDYRHDRHGPLVDQLVARVAERDRDR